MKRYTLVTGGLGFVGRHLVSALVERGERVVVLDVKKVSRAQKLPGVRYVQMDIRNPGLVDVFETYKPAYVYHLAAHIHDRESIDDPVMNAQHNVIGTLNVLQSAAKFNAKKVVFASSCALYGNPEQLPVTIESKPNPGTPYGISKLTGELYADFYWRERKLPYVALRKANIYGPGQDGSAESGAISIFTSRCMSGDQVFVNNDGQSTRDYVYVLDVVSAYLKAAESDYVGPVNVGTGRALTTLEVFEAVQELVGVRRRPDFKEETEDVVKHMVLDSSDAKTRIDWEFTTTFEEGLQKTVEWYRSHL